MLIKMKRSQRTELGMLRAGVAYNINEKTHGKLLDGLLKGKKFAVKTTPKQLAKDADDLAAREAAQMAAAEDGAAEPEMVRQAAAEKAAAELAEKKAVAKQAVADAKKLLKDTKPDTDERKVAEQALENWAAELAELEEPAK